jgi:hypothetical protein
VTRMILSPFMANTPKLASAWQRAGAPPRAAAADAPLDPAWQHAIARAEPGNRDRVGDSAEAPPFSFRTDEALLRRLPPVAAALLRRFDEAATESRDKTLAIQGHINAASDRLASRRVDLHAALRAASQAGLETVDDARRVLASPEGGRWSASERSHAAAIVAAADRVSEAEAELRRLREKLNAHNATAAPITALRGRLVEAAGRLRPPIRALALPEVDPKKAERTLAEAREAIAEARAEIEAIETAPINWHEARALAGEAVKRYAAEAGGLRSAVKWNGHEIVINEPTPGLATEDRRPLRPLALLCAVDPDMVARAIVDMLERSNDSPKAADRPRLIAEARARLREAELRERAAIAALGDPLDMFRPDADPLIALAVEAGR